MYSGDPKAPQPPGVVTMFLLLVTVAALVVGSLTR